MPLTQAEIDEIQRSVNQPEDPLNELELRLAEEWKEERGMTIPQIVKALNSI